MKKSTKVVVSVVALIAAIGLLIFAIISPSEKSTTANMEQKPEISEVVEKVSAKAEKLKQDSLNLITCLNEQIDASLADCYEIDTFDEGTCRVRVTVPENIGKLNAEVLGRGFCTITAQFLAENDYPIDEPGNYIITCYVYSPYQGVTKREGMVTRWGRAEYDPFTDSVEWKWSKE